MACCLMDGLIFQHMHAKLLHLQLRVERHAAPKAGDLRRPALCLQARLSLGRKALNGLLIDQATSASCFANKSAVARSNSVGSLSALAMTIAPVIVANSPDAADVGTPSAVIISSDAL
jgi:hypothetical protein